MKNFWSYFFWLEKFWKEDVGKFASIDALVRSSSMNCILNLKPQDREFIAILKFYYFSLFRFDSVFRSQFLNVEFFYFFFCQNVCFAFPSSYILVFSAFLDSAFWDYKIEFIMKLFCMFVAKLFCADWGGADWGGADFFFRFLRNNPEWRNLRVFFFFS